MEGGLGVCELIFQGWHGGLVSRHIILGQHGQSRSSMPPGGFPRSVQTETGLRKTQSISQTRRAM